MNIRKNHEDGFTPVKCVKKPLPRAVALATAGMVAGGVAQTAMAEEAPPQQVQAAGEIEEVIVVGRLFNAAQQLMNERKDDEVVSDVLGDDTIERLGDTTVAVALRRISGLSLVNEKFVYVRGLGERYSSTMLNGATIPSPDLTRNVIPLDIFPTSIVQSLRVQKSYSADMPAAFGGGAVDIRTKGIPSSFTYSIEIGTGYNWENDGDAFSYAGGGDDEWGVDDGSRALKTDLTNGIQRFLGNLDNQSILNGLRAEGNPNATLADAKLINRSLALNLNRDITVREESIDPDVNIKGSIGNNWLLGENWEFGFLVGGAYKSQWRENERVSRNFNFPTERTDTELESTYTVDITGNLNLGVRFGDEHEISTTTLYLRNTDDETAIRDFFNENREISDEVGFRDYRLQFEERDMTVNQITGNHILGDETRDVVPFFGGLMSNLSLPDVEVNWFYSEARAETNIPNQVSVLAQAVTEPVTGRVLSSSVATSSSAADYRFTALDDRAENYGWSFMAPYQFDNSYLEISGGGEHAQKVRTYAQSQFSLGPLSVADRSLLDGALGDVFSDANILNPANDFVFDLSGTNNQSYLAANMTESVYGKLDYTLADTWRISAGARWEDYKQVAVDWNLYGYTVTSPQVTTDPDRLAETSFAEDNIYPSVSLTYISEYFMGAELFQLRFGWSETVVRPDLREITDASYIDPITDDLVDGNPGVVPSDVTNYDIRAEWFFDNGDNFTISAFLKEIDKPIEFFESAASDTTVAREIVNAATADVSGIEIEGVKELSFLGSWAEPLFIQGNATFQDSELVAGEEADAPTNLVRPLAGASDYVVNMTLGFDSYDGRHTATLVYNVFGERLYVAGRLGAPDGYEQPFHSLDFTYSWFPTERLTVKAKLRNLLDEAIEIEREGVTVFTENPGTAGSVSVKWAW